MSARAQQLAAQLRTCTYTTAGSQDLAISSRVDASMLEAIAELLVDELGWIPPEAYVDLEAHRDELEAAVDRVRRLHDQDESVLARGAWCPADGQPEPCKTVQALNGRPAPPT